MYVIVWDIPDIIPVVTHISMSRQDEEFPEYLFIPDNI
jgi:hypothetical protein